jgi:MFS superfamily sulfate permease-like transporter
MLRSSTVAVFRKTALYFVVITSCVLPQATAFAQPASAPTHSGLPEETLAGFVTQISDGLATKIQGSTCPEAVALLDKIKEASSKAPDQDSLMGKALLDIKTNPKLKDIIAQKVSAPLLNKLLECNMIPLDLMGP